MLFIFLKVTLAPSCSQSPQVIHVFSFLWALLTVILIVIVRRDEERERERERESVCKGIFISFIVISHKWDHTNIYCSRLCPFYLSYHIFLSLSAYLVSVFWSTHSSILYSCAVSCFTSLLLCMFIVISRCLHTVLQ